MDLFPHVHWKDEETEQPQGQSVLEQREKTKLWQALISTLLDGIYFSLFHQCDTSGNKYKMDRSRWGWSTQEAEAFLLNTIFLRYAFWPSSAQQK